MSRSVTVHCLLSLFPLVMTFTPCALSRLVCGSLLAALTRDTSNTRATNKAQGIVHPPSVPVQSIIQTVSEAEVVSRAWLISPANLAVCVGNRASLRSTALSSPKHHWAAFLLLFIWVTLPIFNQAPSRDDCSPNSSRAEWGSQFLLETVFVPSWFAGCSWFRLGFGWLSPFLSLLSFFRKRGCVPSWFPGSFWFRFWLRYLSPFFLLSGRGLCSILISWFLSDCSDVTQLLWVSDSWAWLSCVTRTSASWLPQLSRFATYTGFISMKWCRVFCIRPMNRAVWVYVKC